MEPQRTTADTVGVKGQRLLRVDDIADYLNVSRSMAWKLVASGEIPAVRVGRAVRVKPEAVEEYIERAGEG